MSLKYLNIIKPIHFSIHSERFVLMFVDAQNSKVLDDHFVAELQDWFVFFLKNLNSFDNCCFRETKRFFNTGFCSTGFEKANNLTTFSFSSFRHFMSMIQNYQSVILCLQEVLVQIVLVEGEYIGQQFHSQLMFDHHYCRSFHFFSE